MQKIEYICDWCHTEMPKERANHLSVQPVFVPLDGWAILSKAEGSEPSEKAAHLMEAMKDRDKERDRRSIDADICDSCFAKLRGWIETQGTER